MMWFKTSGIIRAIWGHWGPQIKLALLGTTMTSHTKHTFVVVIAKTCAVFTTPPMVDYLLGDYTFLCYMLYSIIMHYHPL